MKVKKESTDFDSSIFFKKNMQINKNLPIVYGITLVISIIVAYIGSN